LLRTVTACAATAAVTAAVMAGVGFGSGADSRAKTIPVGGTAIFTHQDLICVNSTPGGAPKFPGQTGIACSSYASPYRGIGLWVTRTKVVVTRPPNERIVASFRR
jgi:hypothetical protein